MRPLSFRSAVRFAFPSHLHLLALVGLLAVTSIPVLHAQAVTTTTLTVTAKGAPVTSVATGTVVTLTASVTVGTAPVVTGQVDLCDATAAYCTDIHILGSAQLTSAGTAIFRITPGAQTHTYKAVFLGTSADAKSVSATQSLSVTATNVETSAAISASGSAGSYSVTGTVSGFGNSGLAPSGAVQFLDVTSANAVLGSATLSPAGASFTMVSGTSPSIKGGAVAAGDFNNDGHSDVVAFDGSGNLNVALGNGDGTFQTLPASQLLSYTSIAAIVTGDFNADGKLDLAVVSSNAYATILLGNGDGTFTVGSSPSVGSFPAAIAAGDFNGDGKLDLAIANDQSDNMSILLGNGNGTFTASAPVSTSAGPGSVVTADFDGDGVLDLAVLTFANYTVTVYHGNGDGSFTAVSTPAYASFDIGSLATADLNGDGKADLVVSGSGYGPIPLLGNGDGTFTLGTLPAFSFTLPYGNMAVADFNGDGKPDVAVLNANSNSATGPDIFLGNGDGTFTVTGPYPGLSSDSLAVADFNGDGSPDLFFVDGYSTETEPLELLLGESGLTSTATATAISPIGTGTHQVMAVYAGDTNFAGSSSATIGLTATQVTPTLTISANPMSGTYGQQIMLSATLAPYSEPGLSTDGEPVSFYSGSSYLGSGNLSSGVATLNVTSLGVGNDSLTAQYAGDADLTEVASTAISFLNAQATPTITWTTPAPITYGTALTNTQLDAVSSTAGTLIYTPAAGAVLGAGTQTLSTAFTPTDTTDYKSATAATQLVVNQAPLTLTAANATRVFGVANPAFTGTVSGAVNGDTFTESFATTASAASTVGTYSIVPSVSGAARANYAVVATNGTLTVTQAGTTTTLALSNQNLTLTAAVSSQTTGSPTGSVGFYGGQTLIGMGTISNGVASFTASSLPAGDVVLSAQYSGDGNFMSSSSTPVPVLTVAPTTNSLTVVQSGSVTDSLNLSVAPGYAGTVQFSCTGLPANSICSFQPASAMFNTTTNSLSETLTVQTGETSAANAFPGMPGDGAPLLALIFAPGLLALCVGRRKGSRANWLVPMVFVLCGLAFGLGGCGGSGSSSTTPPPSTTPAGTYTFQVVASGPDGLALNTSLTLTVQ